MNVVATMMARGSGSTLLKKNAYPILGKPMLRWCLEEVKRARFIDHVFIWTGDEELSKITEDCECIVIPRSKDEICYGGGFSNPNDWGLMRTAFIEKYIGGKIDIAVHLNCNYVLMTAEILEAMFWQLMDDPMAKDIWPVTKIHGHYFMLHNKKLFPVWHCQDLDRQAYPELVVRGSGISITHNKRQRDNVSLQSTYYEVEAKYLLDVHDKEDIELAEFYLQRRKNENNH